MSIIDSFCAEIKLFCETFNSSEYFQVVRENINISSDLGRSRQKQLENFLTSTESATKFTQRNRNTVTILKELIDVRDKECIGFSS